MHQVLALSDSFDFLDQIYPKKVFFSSKSEKGNITIEFCIYELV